MSWFDSGWTRLASLAAILVLQLGLYLLVRRRLAAGRDRHREDLDRAGR